MKYKLLEFDNEDDFWQRLIKDYSLLSDDKLLSFDIAASGGSASKLFDYLDADKLKTSQVYIADERFVPESHEHSNALLLKSKLTETNKINDSQLITWKTGSFSIPQDCAENYTKLIPNQFHLCILGVGSDGHTASLFPQGEWLEKPYYQNRKCLVSTTDEFAVRERLSLSFTTIEKSKNIWILMIGKSKQEILDIITAEETDYHKYPARHILNFDPTIYFLNN